MGYTDTRYGDWPLVRDRLVELGVKHVRDASYRDGTRTSDVVPRYNELAGLGVRGNLLSGDPLRRYGSGTIDEHLAWVKRNVAGFVESLEGPNEYDYVETDWAANLRAYQCEWAAKIRGDGVLADKTVIGPSPRVGKGFGSALGDLSDCLDRGNLHPYPGGLSPDATNYGDLSISLDFARLTSGTKPLWLTETGYHNAVGAPAGGHHPTSQKAAGVYVPRMFMENFRRGIERTYSYELLDQWPDPENDEAEKNFGLVANDGSRKPAFVALRNLLTILDDSGSASGKLAYSLACQACSDTLRHVLLRKSTGAYYMVVWPQSSVWNRDTRTDITNNPHNAELKLPSSSKLELFDPSRSTTPTDTTTSTSYTIPLTDHLSILKITPPTSEAPVPPPSPQPAPADPGPAPAPAAPAPP
ncbi:MAG: hypothetical protein M3396_11500, partial [Actinomycetota bacterium]|nr:hypothetical protein [Actinomycetota bacterium]